jgi:NADH-quinone oxidoreductase subunit F/NAD(P)H dehydrogenase (quinone)/NADP-reducing hydrogenase subunit HndC
MEFEVDPVKCKKCGLCAKGCPVDAVTWKKKEIASINKDKCIKCMTCISNCKFDAIF